MNLTLTTADGHTHHLRGEWDRPYGDDRSLTLLVEEDGQGFPLPQGAVRAAPHPEDRVRMGWNAYNGVGRHLGWFPVLHQAQKRVEGAVVLERFETRRTS